jgi:hypothetical protein
LHIELHPLPKKQQNVHAQVRNIAQLAELSELPLGA